jgi:hypothetical protein
MDGGPGLGSGWIGAVAVGLGLLVVAATPAQALTRCQLEYSLDGWSVFYKEAAGDGVIECDNGQRARVDLETRGGGITFGRSKIVGGLGDFSPVVDIDDLFGDYADAQAHAGMGVSAQAHVVTKGAVSLSLSGRGNGVDLGFAFGRFTIRPAGRAAEPRRADPPPPPPPGPSEEPIGDEDLPSSDPVPPNGY